MLNKNIYIKNPVERCNFLMNSLVQSLAVPVCSIKQM